jgi:hypothetical protein
MPETAKSGMYFQGRTGHCGNAANATRLFLRMRGILKISEKSRLFQRLRGFLNTFVVELSLFESDVKLFRVMWGLCRILRVCEDIFRERMAFDYKCEAFIKVTREDIFAEMKAWIRNLRLFQILRGFLKTFEIKLRHFERFWGFLKTFSEKYEAFIKVTRLFEDISNGNEGFLKWCEAFLNYFQRNGGFFH